MIFSLPTLSTLSPSLRRTHSTGAPVTRAREANLLDLVSNHGLNYPTPVNLSYFWGFGSLAGFCLFLQLTTGIRPSLRGLPPPAQPSAGEVLARLTFHPLCRRGVPDGRYLAMLEPLSPKHSFFGRRDISLAQRQRQSAVFDTYR